MPAGVDPVAELAAAKQGVEWQVPGSKVTAEKKIEVGGIPGRELDVDPPANLIPGGAKLKVRILISKGKMYQLQRIQPASVQNASDDELAGFYNSLKIMD